ncbi:MAG TPA: RsmB/NOP family class I SAM-dependent RNA methyltransferase [Allosphingosinicella sp.]|nr:RsmB/NOP family class I SAM-dependent RNA methyltransferase [Allosphingosinicella sp.]
MTPAARVQAAIEILDEVIRAARESGAAADTLVTRYFKARRYAGSGDRRAIRELVFRAIRKFAEPISGRAALIGLAADDPGLRDCFDGSSHAPADIGPNEVSAQPALVPAWLRPRFDPLIGEDEFPALLERAPIDLRVNRLRGEIEAAQKAFPEARRTPHSPIGLRLPEGPYGLQTHEAWLSGLVEVQDEGSQLICLASEAQASMTVVDLCAGAGGKSLALAAEMGNSGRIVAADTDRGRLDKMRARLDRAGVLIVERRLLDPGRESEALDDLVGQADLVLVDAPCSGTGTWRRNPETRWRVNPARLAQLGALQARLLDLAETFLRPGGRLVYAVCSLLAEEGREQAEALTRRSSLVPETMPMPAGRTAGSGMLLSPGRDGTDGFFVARWRRPC